VVALRDAVLRLENERGVQVVLMSGRGQTFSSGGDLKGYVELYGRPTEFRRFLDDFWDLLDRIERSAKIYVGKIEGYCVAGGLELLLALDIVVASQSARIGDAHVNFGQLPGAGGSQRLPRAVGALRAKLLMLTGDIISAHEAERIGLVSVVAPDGEIDAVTDRIVQRLLTASPAGLVGAKHLVNTGMHMQREDALRMEMDYVHRYVTSVPDATEGLIAFQEKRKPRFSSL
jgi:enoyl-CoA hydratase/carnithine racemase